MRPRLLLAGLLVIFLFPLACGDGTSLPTQSAGRPVVYTTFYPTTYFVERLAGDLVEVVCPVPADEDAIFWQPTSEIIQKYQAADLIVVNGAEFEKWVTKTSLPLARLVNTAKPFESELLRFKTGVTHSHGPAGKHEHKGIDGHTWLDPVNAKLQVGEIQTALKKLLSGDAEAIDSNGAALLADLDSLDAELRRMSELYQGELFLASHPAYNYLTRRYGWNLVNVTLDPETFPEAKIMAALAEAQQKTPARYVLWECEPTKEIRERFKQELHLTSVVFSPCELMAPEDLESGADYMTVMRKNLADLAAVLTPKPQD